MEQWFEVKHDGTNLTRKIVNTFQSQKAKPQTKHIKTLKKGDGTSISNATQIFHEKAQVFKLQLRLS